MTLAQEKAGPRGAGMPAAPRGGGLLRAACLGAALLLPAGAPAASAQEEVVGGGGFGIEVQEVVSPGGITAWLYEERTIPIVTMEASFRGGPALEPEGEAGATALMASLLSEGAAGRDATAFAEAVESLASSLRFNATADAVTVSATALAEDFEETLALLRDALVEPRFDPEDFARARARQLATLRADASDASRVASRAFWAEAFPDGPYDRPPDGTIEAVEALGREDVVEAHRRALLRDRLLIAVVGAIDAETLGPLLDATFGALPEEGPAPPAPREAATGGWVRLIELGIPQSVVVFGHGGIPRDDPDFIPAFVLDHILGGGGFGSRLMAEIRERRGLTYGIYTYLAPNDLGWLYLGSFSTANDRVAEAIGLVREEWARIAEEGVSAEEIERARRFLTGAYPLRFDGNGRIASQLLGLQIAGLGPDYVNERNALVEAVTAEDVARVAGRLLDPEALSFVVVGQPEGLEAVERR